MAIDWGQARLIGFGGFGVVFLLLAFLSVLIWLTGVVIRKIDSGKAGSEDKEQKGA